MNPPCAPPARRVRRPDRAGLPRPPRAPRCDHQTGPRKEPCAWPRPFQRILPDSALVRSPSQALPDSHTCVRRWSLLARRRIAPRIRCPVTHRPSGRAARPGSSGHPSPRGKAHPASSSSRPHVSRRHKPRSRRATAQMRLHPPANCPHRQTRHPHRSIPTHDGARPPIASLKRSRHRIPRHPRSPIRRARPLLSASSSKRCAASRAGARRRVPCFGRSVGSSRPPTTSRS